MDINNIKKSISDFYTREKTLNNTFNSEQLLRYASGLVHLKEEESGIIFNKEEREEFEREISLYIKEIIAPRNKIVFLKS